MDRYYDPKSGMDKGRLCHLNNLLDQRSVSRNVSESFITCQTFCDS